MDELFRPSGCQMGRISPLFPLPRGVPKVDLRVVSGIVYVINHNPQRKDARRALGRTRRATIR